MLTCPTSSTERPASVGHKQFQREIELSERPEVPLPFPWYMKDGME